MISENGPRLSSEKYQNTYHFLGLTKTFTYGNHYQTNGQVERLNRSITTALRCYVSDHFQNWDTLDDQLTHAYNIHIHSATGTRPFDIVQFETPPEITMYEEIADPVETTQTSTINAHDHPEFPQRLETGIGAARNTLTKTPERYK